MENGNNKFEFKTISQWAFDRYFGGAPKYDTSGKIYLTENKSNKTYSTYLM